ncbi:efflux RND transporter permease subunit [Caldalkalibacillus mannanilyticus]|uniref:efflux RND transporter permease subunit n=1 Tax=Caldalkalibacillus mannanilyticus TaxID=1418 RepID=UPI00046AC04B|nr:efflux RND transporter permease subunit [Caldalkalibacillus mannanilyticus]
MNLAKLSVYRPVAMSMVIFFILVIGLVSLNGLTVDLFPELEFPIAAITASYPGIGPEEIEALIVGPLENIVGTIPNVESINSTSRLGGALLIVQFDWGTDMNFATLQIRERIDMIRESLPNDVPLPMVLKFDPRMLPIIQLAISSPSYDIVETKRLAENRIKPRLEPLNGIAAVNVEGGRETEIQLTFDPRLLREHQLSLQTIQQILAGENINLPGGLIHDNQLDVPLRIIGQFQSIQDIEQIQVPTGKGEIIPLSTLAKIEETFKATTMVSFLNGEDSVGITIQKQTDANTVNVANQVNKVIEELRAELPADVSIEPIFDQSLYIKQSIRTVSINMLIGSLLAGIILFLFLQNFRSTLIVAFAIPISIVTTFIFMYFTNQTLNLLTLGGLALGVGMMVDNSIVIIENIYRYRQQGASLKEAAVKGTSEVGPAVFASTITTVIVFLPILFVEGLAAQLFTPLALSVTYALLASLFTSLIIVPLLSSKLIYIEEEEKSSTFQKAYEGVQNKYKQLLAWALKNPKKVITTVVLLFLTSLSGILFIGREFLPEQDQSIVYLDVRLPVGSSLDHTIELSQEVDQRLNQVPEIKNIYVNVGGAGQFQLSAGSLTNRANYNLQLVPLGERNRSDKEVAEEIRHLLNDLPDVRVNVSTGDSGFGGSAIHLSVRGPDVKVLESLAHEVTSIIQNVEGVREPTSDFTTGQREIQAKINRMKAAQYGISSIQVASIIRESLEGMVASRLSQGGNEIDIRLLYTPSAQAQMDYLKSLEIASPLGMNVPLEVLVDFTEEISPHSIKRVNRIREVAVNAQLLNRDLGSTIDEIREILAAELPLPSGYSIHFGGQNEQMNDALMKLTGAVLLAIVLVYMVMAAQFESYFFPFIIMFAVPLTAIGIISGLLITFRPVGVGSMVGILVLTGIVVNNAIVFIDYVNTLRKQGLNRDEALLTAGPIRLRPILMTTLTTILALVPLMLGYGEGSEIQAPMATVIIFGLSFATLITLVFIPVVYKLLDEWRERRNAKKTAME